MCYLLQRETSLAVTPQTGGAGERWGTRPQRVSEGSLKAITSVDWIPFHTSYMRGKVRRCYVATTSGCRLPPRHPCRESARCLEYWYQQTFLWSRHSASVPVVQLGNWGQGGLQFSLWKKYSDEKKPPVQLTTWELDTNKVLKIWGLFDSQAQYKSRDYIYPLVSSNTRQRDIFIFTRAAAFY